MVKCVKSPAREDVLQLRSRWSVYSGAVAASCAALLWVPPPSCLRYALQLYPQRKESTETYKVPLTRVVYIERTDFRAEDADDYYGLAPGKTVMLRYTPARLPASATVMRSHLFK